MKRVACHICSVEGVHFVTDDAWGTCESCGAVLFFGQQGPKIAILHASRAIGANIGTVLVREGMRPLHVSDADAALGVMLRESVAGLVLDVGLESVPFFDVIERVRGHQRLAATKIVLVASVYNKTAYKRRPKSLHGADDYVEEHHVADHLPERLGALIDIEVDPHPSMEDVAALNAEIEEAERLRTLAGEARIRAMAQRIVADIALYMEREVREAREGEIGRSLSAALDEGRRVLRALGGEVTVKGDPIGDAFEEVRRWPRRGA